MTLIDKASLLSANLPLLEELSTFSWLLVTTTWSCAPSAIFNMIDRVAKIKILTSFPLHIAQRAHARRVGLTRTMRVRVRAYIVMYRFTGICAPRNGSHLTATQNVFCKENCVDYNPECHNGCERYKEGYVSKPECCDCAPGYEKVDGKCSKSVLSNHNL